MHGTRYLTEHGAQLVNGAVAATPAAAASPDKRRLMIKEGWVVRVRRWAERESRAFESRAFSAGNVLIRVELRRLGGNCHH